MTIIGVFPPPILSVTCFSAHVFPRAPLLTCFPALSTDHMFSRFFHRLQVSPRFPPATCFPALSTGCLTSRAIRWLQVSPRFPLVTCFPAHSTGCLFSRAFHWSHVTYCYNWSQKVIRNRVIFTCSHRHTLLLKTPKYLPSTS